MKMKLQDGQLFSAPSLSKKSGWAAVLILSCLMTVMLSLLLVSLKTKAADDEGDDDGAKTAHVTSGEKLRRHNYPGGRDEEDLTLQTVLPQPVRSPDAVPGAPDPAATSHD